MKALRATLGAGVMFLVAACGSTGAGGTKASPASQSTSQLAGAATTAEGPAVTAVPVSTGAVTIQNFAFGPKAITVKVGQEVTWTNKDGDSHTVSFDAGDPKSGVLAPNATYAHSFNSPGTFAYHCSIHSTMHGVVMVTP